MKRFLAFIVLAAMLISYVPFTASASELISSTETIYLEDGSYIVVELNITEQRSTSSKTASKSYVFNGSSGEVKWKATLTGTFTYNGTSASCTAASCTVSITDDVWYVISKSASKSGNSAIGNVIMGRKFLGIKIDEETLNMKITCDGNGNIS